jgi:hypothetical protein
LPLDAGFSPLWIGLFWYGVALPALTSFGVLLASWPLWRRATNPERGAGPIALALGAGYAIGHVGIEGWRPFPPREAADRLWYLVGAAVALSLLDIWRSCPPWLRWASRALLWLAVVWLLLPASIRKVGTQGELAAWLFGLGTAGLLFWAALAATVRHSPGVLSPLLLLITSAGTTGVLYYAHSLKYTQLAGAVTTVLAPILLRSACRPPAPMPTAPVMVLLPGLWLVGYFYAGFDASPLPSLALLAAATLTGGIAILPGIREMPSWQRFLLCGLLASLLTWLAFIEAQGTRKGDEELFLRGRSVFGAGSQTARSCQTNRLLRS